MQAFGYDHAACHTRHSYLDPQSKQLLHPVYKHSLTSLRYVRIHLHLSLSRPARPPAPIRPVRVVL